MYSPPLVYHSRTPVRFRVFFCIWSTLHTSQVLAFYGHIRLGFRGYRHRGTFRAVQSGGFHELIMRFPTVAAGLAVSAVGSVSGFVSPTPTSAFHSSAFLRHGAGNARLVSSLATLDRAPTSGATASTMSLKPSRKQRCPLWLRPVAAGKGLGRGLSLLRGAAAERDDDEEMYEYEDGEGDDYDGEEDLDRWAPSPSGCQMKYKYMLLRRPCSTFHFPTNMRARTAVCFW